MKTHFSKLFKKIQDNLKITNAAISNIYVQLSVFPVEMAVYQRICHKGTRISAPFCQGKGTTISITY
jgi:hypothetical protein